MDQRIYPACIAWILCLGLLLASDQKTLKAQTAYIEDEGAYFQFDIPPAPERFTFMLTDPEKIQQAREMLSGARPSRHIMGKVIKQSAAYNPPWSYHLEPSSIEFFDFAIEVCDASILGVENNLELVCGSFLPDCTWCPWASRLLAEVIPPGPTPAQWLFLPLVLNRND